MAVIQHMKDWMHHSHGSEHGLLVRIEHGLTNRHLWEALIMAAALAALILLGWFLAGQSSGVETLRYYPMGPRFFP